MNTPEWLKPGINGALIGAVCVGVVGFTWGGWVTGGTANERAMAMSRDDVVASMVPVCLDMARSDPARAEKLETIRAASTYQRRDALMVGDWATVPGTDAPIRGDISEAWIRAASTYQRRDALMAAGWATVPGTDAPDRDIAQACLAALEL